MLKLQHSLNMQLADQWMCCVEKLLAGWWCRGSDGHGRWSQVLRSAAWLPWGRVLSQECYHYVADTTAGSFQSHFTALLRFISLYCRFTLLLFIFIHILHFLLHNVMLAQYMLSLCVCLSVRHTHCTKTAHCMITQTTLSPGTLVFWYKRSRRNFNWVTPNGGAK